MTAESIEKIYDRYSGFYDLLFGRPLEKGREMAPDLLALFPGARLLEAGVGTGLSIPHLPRNIEITGIDISQTMLDRARNRVESLGFRDVRLLRMDAGRLEFPDDSFDRVLAAYFISTVAQPVQVVRELMRVCRPGGSIVFLNHFLSEDPIVAFVERAISPVCRRLGFRTDLDLLRLLAESGLVADRVDGIDPQGRWKAVRCLNPGCVNPG
jgi:phosphatidylethanolamine/phosphatidyl-N-methylethanolamine N-methyltransferase